MPRYEVTVQGQGIAVPIQAAFAVRFLRLVEVIARDSTEAQVRAVERVRSEWSAGAHTHANRGGQPYLTVTSIGLLSWWHRLLGAPRGYLFFSEEGVQLSPDRPGN